MEFYGKGIVWDKDKNIKLCKFMQGIYNTSDEYIISSLIKLGYKNNGTDVLNIVENVIEDAEIVVNNVN